MYVQLALGLTLEVEIYRSKDKHQHEMAGFTAEIKITAQLVGQRIKTVKYIQVKKNN